MFETTFRNLDDTLRKDAGCSSELGDVDSIRRTFVDFQQHLYAEVAA